MIESIQFTNFKALRNATLPLAPFTLLMGPNGSGKSTVLQALQDIAGLANEAVGQGGNLRTNRQGAWAGLVSVTEEDKKVPVEISVRLRVNKRLFIARFQWHPHNVQVTGNLCDECGSVIGGAGA